MRGDGLTGVDPRLVASVARQLEARRAALDAGARHVGWKLGMGESERIGAHPAVGHLTSASLLDGGATYRARSPIELRADAEVMVEVDPGAQIRAYAAALEIVDLGTPAPAALIVASNVFHRAVAFGPTRSGRPAGLHGALLVNGEVRDRAPAPVDIADRVRAAAAVLAAAGERLRAGDRVITGSIVQVPVAPGDEVVADLGALGRVALTIAG